MKLLLTTAWLAVTAASFYDGWKLPDYCMDPKGMAARQAIPPLQTSRNLELVQAQVVARHGARAPPVSVTWNCSTNQVWTQNLDEGSQARGYGRLYRKQYINHRNVLNGTCMVGGLLPIGREQHRQNGAILRDAYIGDGPRKLFSTNKIGERAPHELLLRSDDQERTLGSGQALVDTLFPYSPEDEANVDAMLTWMTADANSDYIDHRRDTSCPMLDRMAKEINNSPAVVAHRNSPAVLSLQARFNAIVGVKFQWDTCLECLMIARCNNLPLPDGTTEELFDALIHEVQTRTRMKLTYQNGAYAKLDMQHMWRDILKRVDAAIHDPSSALKLSITMGHDSTLMPMMAVAMGPTWDGHWTTYAGMLDVDMDRRHGDAFAIRLVYNGKPLQLPFCNDELCPWSTFNASLSWARETRQCKLPTKASTRLDTNVATHQPSGAWFLLPVGAFLAVVGTLATRQSPYRRETDPLLG
ncbi:hypothetical protein SPRG_00327 [Saprolegnia parasitica CBS 223.65]|uniref:Histidine acid phosphatase n=1 Tax=Saprolegnia parasitica (strain CBS 223.65) TaxID=695850 RepID=A0A067D1U4_SAPPC|nr:hypothetical protein SPRG_00327 [Saprolegnia parasitica CBS 223.65]KDO35480.1 hypothetical protein SPRG_00327 [Saprolegnia parasitica CBS 223.65]|eukprot:XP_012193817.1 hypothetical protein SPRG_00327 [Saprolegnia parasitica CBS 223.65]